MTDGAMTDGWIARLGGWLGALVGDRRGSIAVPVAITSVMLLGGVSLGTEVVSLLYTQRQMQAATDAAALGAATAVMTGHPAQPADEARGLARMAGFINNVDNVTVQVNQPPHTGPYTGRADAVEVIISRPAELVLGGMLKSDSFTLKARSVALVGSTGSFCVLVLDPTQDEASKNSGTTFAELINCGMAVNSSSPSALTMKGTSYLFADSVSIVGDYTTTGGGTIMAANGITTHASPIPDPYANIPVPSIGPCTYNNYSANSHAVATLSPGVYCNGITISGNSQITLNPGIYIIDRGELSMTGASSLIGNDVTIVLTSSTGSNYATVSISGGSVVEINAPSSGPTAGLAFFQDQNAPPEGSNRFNGGATQIFYGALYFPRQEVFYSGGNEISSRCNQIISRLLTLTGNALLKLECDGLGIEPIGARPARLVE